MSEAKAAGVLPCESCGAELEFQLGQRTVACPHCRHSHAIAAPGEVPDRDLNEALLQHARPGEVGQVSSARIPIDGFLPFRVSLEEAQERIRTWRETLAFAPTGFAPARRLVEGVRAVYLPFWCFDAFATGSGNVQHFVDDLLVPATADLSEWTLRKLEPWPLQQLEPYVAESLSGVPARDYDVELETGFARCRERAQRAEGSDLAFAAPRYRQLLLPVYRANGAVALNGVTGALASTRPYTVLQRIQRLVGLETWRRRR